VFILSVRGWCRFAAMTNHQTRMRNTRRTTPLLITLLAALCGTYPVHGQESHLAQLNPGSGHPGTAIVRSPISDDGDELNELLPAKLLITFSGSGAAPVLVDVFDETGKLVMQRSAPADPGRQFLPLDVAGLPSGRYVVRVQEGAAVGTSRFLRP
jgi:hypothetical protein